MNWLILFFICVLVSVAAFLLAGKLYFEEWPIAVGVISALVAIVCIVVLPVNTYFARTEESLFVEQKKYIESHVSQTEIEDAALTSKKVELNAWLFEAQYKKSHYKNWSFYSAEILDWEPIQ